MKIDGRTLDHQSSETIRIMAVKRIKEDGEKPSEVIKSYGLARTTVYLWLNKYDEGGYDALKSTKGTGRPQILNEKEMQKLRKLLIGKDPRQYGFDFGLWSLQLICELVSTKFKKDISIPTAQRLLHKLNITPQRPLSKAYEQDPKAFADWKKKEYPKIKKKAAKMGANIYFLDESGFKSRENYGRTWGERGHTPVVKLSKKYQSINAISIMSPQGNFFYDVYSGRFNSERFIEILKKFVSGKRKPMFMILDNLSIHKSKAVKEYLSSLDGKLQFFFLPTYSSELNPVEFVWNYAKQNGISKKPLKKDEKIKTRVEADMESIKNNRRLVKSFFCATTVDYIMK